MKSVMFNRKHVKRKETSKIKMHCSSLSDNTQFFIQRRDRAHFAIAASEDQEELDMNLV